MAHELRTPLSRRARARPSWRCATAAATPSGASALEAVLAGTDRMAAVIDTLLAAARSDGVARLLGRRRRRARSSGSCAPSPRRTARLVVHAPARAADRRRRARTSSPARCTRCSRTPSATPRTTSRSTLARDDGDVVIAVSDDGAGVARRRRRADLRARRQRDRRRRPRARRSPAGSPARPAATSSPSRSAAGASSCASRPDRAFRIRSVAAATLWPSWPIQLPPESSSSPTGSPRPPSCSHAIRDRARARPDRGPPARAEPRARRMAPGAPRAPRQGRRRRSSVLAQTLPELRTAAGVPVDGFVSTRHDPMDAIEELLHDETGRRADHRHHAASHRGLAARRSAAPRRASRAAGDHRRPATDGAAT